MQHVQIMNLMPTSASGCSNFNADCFYTDAERNNEQSIKYTYNSARHTQYHI